MNIADFHELQKNVKVRLLDGSFANQFGAVVVKHRFVHQCPLLSLYYKNRFRV